MHSLNACGASLIAVTALELTSGCAMSKPDFTGTWKFNAAVSRLQIPAPESSEFVILHREPQFRLTRTLVMGGVRDTFSIDLWTDGRPTQIRHRDMDVKAVAKWEGPVLIFDSILTREGKPGHNVVRYSLSADRQTIFADEYYEDTGHSHHNQWVLDRE